MQGKGSQKKCLGRIVVLNMLFVVCLMGIVLGAALYQTVEGEAIIYGTQTSPLIVLRRCVICYGTILVFAKMSFGLILTPLAVCLRGMILGITAFAHTSGTEYVVSFLLPAFIELSVLFYLASASMRCSYRNLRSLTVDQDCIEDMRNSVYCAVSATAFGVIAFLIV